MVYFTSDLHIHHKNICEYRINKGFKTTEEHDNYWIHKILSLGKRDILYILGDFIFDTDVEIFNQTINKLSNIKCRIKVIMGNHDSLSLYKIHNPKIEIQLPLFTYKDFWLSHCPIHPQEMWARKGNVHGHLHNAILDDKLYFDVSPEKHNYEFVTLDKIKEYYEYNEYN